MRQRFPKHTFHRKEHPDFISLTSLSLLMFGLFILLYLLSLCHLPSGEHTSLTRFASAREQETEDNKISEAVSLSGNKNHKISLSPYSHRYFYIVLQRNYSLQILSGSTSIQVSCYSQNGDRLKVPHENRQYHFGDISGTSLSYGDRIFLKFTNMSTKPSTIKVRYSKSPAAKTTKKHTATPKPKKAATSRNTSKAQKKTKTSRTARNTTPTASKPSRKADHTSPTTPRPSRTAPTVPKVVKKATPKPSQAAKHKRQKRKKPAQVPAFTVKPHFIQLTVGSRKELFLSLGESALTLADCTYFLTDTSVLSIQGNTLTAKKAGITILYIRSKKSATCNSCLIRVTETKKS